MRLLVAASLTILISSALAGCDSLDKLLEAQSTIAAQEEKLQALQSQVESLAGELNAVKTQQANLEMSNMFRDWEKIAYLQPGDSGYAPIRFDLGVLTVQMSDVKAYANGSKISLKFGNPLATSINGLKVKVEWGRVDDKGVTDNETAKSKEFTFSETLGSGAWTTIPVVLDAIPPSELGFVRVREVTHTGISLAK